MKHGQNCDCMMCTLGKKMGMISNKKNDDQVQCKQCGQSHTADMACDQK